MKAMVFAAGHGLRLRPITEKLPKALIPVAGRPMIEYSLLLLRYYGIKEIVINLHYMGEKIEEYLGEGEKLGLKISYSREQELLDTGGGLLRASPFLMGDTFIVMNSDIIIDLPLVELIDQHRRHGAIGTLVLRPDAEADLYGPIEISADLRIRRFLDHKAPPKGSVGALTKFMFTGVQILEPKVFEHMKNSVSLSGVFSITKVTYSTLLTQGGALYGFPFHGYWQDLGTAERIREAEEKLKHGEVKLHYLDK
jgi:mannose-1-phosphate guanylyltransferase